jgi:hypothetical protein
MTDPAILQVTQFHLVYVIQNIAFVGDYSLLILCSIV